jgi:hypothetical protein
MIMICIVLERVRQGVLAEQNHPRQRFVPHSIAFSGNVPGLSQST